MKNPKKRTDNPGHAANQAGFTLIEIMVVVVILSILATVVVLNVGDAPDEARDRKSVV